MFLQALLTATGIFIFLFFTYGVVISLHENEKRAACLLLLFGVILLIPIVLLLTFDFYYGEMAGWVLQGLYLLVPAVLFFPADRKHRSKPPQPVGRIDERDIMFSRQRYIAGTDRYNRYYAENPEKEIADKLFREKPGLLKPGSTYYHPLLFNAADSSFDTVAALRPLVDGVPHEEKLPVKPDEITAFIKKWAKKLGAKDVGVTLLKDYHKYSVVGRGDDFGKPVVLEHKYAIAFTVEMDREMIDTAPQAPAVVETSQQYLEAGKIAVQIAVLIRRLGYEARAHIDGNYRVVCPLVAADAGLGDLGRMGLLITPKLGPRVRIAVVTTNVPLVTDKKIYDPTIEDFCKICKKCAVTCPARAIPFDDPWEINGVKRWQINQEKCYTFWCQVGTDCGKCVSVCPYSHPDNFFHNLIRYGIRRNFLFRQIAVMMDDLFYGKKPRAKVTPKKIKV